MNILKMSLLILFCSATVHAQDKTPANRPNQKRAEKARTFEEDDGWLLRFIHTIGDQPEKFEFFLKEIELSPDQRREFLVDIKQYMKQMKAAYQELNVMQKKSFFDKSETLKKQLEKAKPKPDQLASGIITKLKDSLLEHQIIRMKQAIYQRVYLQAVDVESFQLPLLLKGLEMTPDQKTELEGNVSRLKKQYESEKNKLRMETWKKILGDLPQDVRKETIELLDLEKVQK